MTDSPPPSDPPKAESAAGAGCMTRIVRRECSMATSMLGDGCRFCNPELGAELQWNSEADEYNQWDDLGQDERDQLVADFITANVRDQGSAPSTNSAEERNQSNE